QEEENKIESSDADNKSEPGMRRSPDSGTRTAEVVTRRPWIVALVVLLIASAAAFTFWLRSGSSSQAGRPVPAPTGEPVPSFSESGTQPRPGEIIITLTADKLQNAQIKTETATVQPGGAVAVPGPRTTGTVQANAYKEVPILPIAGGI